MYGSASQYGAAPAAQGYRASPVQMSTGRQYTSGQVAYPVYVQHATHTHGQHVPQQQRYPVGYGQPVAGVPVQPGMQPMMVSGQYPQQAYYQQQQAAQHQQQQQQQQQQQPRRQHKGTIPPGQIVRVGNNTVRVERYLSEGGYAHVYLTTSEKPIYPPSKQNGTSKGRWGEKGYTEHCLKRIAFDDENVWVDVSKEIEVMVSCSNVPRCRASACSSCTRAGYVSVTAGRVLPLWSVTHPARNRSRHRHISSSTSTRRTTGCRTARMRCSS